MSEVAAALTESLGKPIEYQRIPIEAIRQWQSGGS